MPKPVKLKTILKVLNSKGFFFVSQRGSHAKFRKIGKPACTVIVKTTHKEIPYGTFKSILEQSNLEENDFKE